MKQVAKRAMCMFIIIAMVLNMTCINAISYGDEIKKQIDAQNFSYDLQGDDSYDLVVNEALLKLRNYYKSESIDYMTAMAYYHSGDGVDTELIYKNLRTYNASNLYNCYKGIMEAIASEMDPRSFEAEGNTFDYVTSLENLQKADGSFSTGIDAQAYCMLALDMVAGSYDSEAAARFLADKIGENGSVSGDLKNTALAVLALSNHKKIAGVEEKIDKAVSYIKSKQESDGGFFSDNPVILGPVIQALIAAGEDPLKGDYVKGGRTMLDVLMEYQNSDGTFFKDTWYKVYDKNSTEAAFAALSDLSKNSSMFHDLKIEIGDTPHEIILKSSDTSVIVGKTLKVNAKVVDDVGRVVTGQSITWTSSNDEIAVVTKGAIKGISAGNVKITAALEGNESIRSSVNIDVLELAPSQIKLYTNSTQVTGNIKIKKGESIGITAKAFDKDGDEITGIPFEWEITAGNDFITLENGVVKAVSKGEASIKVKYKGIDETVNITVQDVEDLALETLNEAKTYIDTFTSYDALTALALSHMGESRDNISQKLYVRESCTSAREYAENIIGIIAAGKDPRNYNGRNYVKELIDTQDNTGYFKVGYTYDYNENLIYPIIALNMAGAKYNYDKSLDRLILNAKVFQDTRVFDGKGSIRKAEMTALAVIAMSDYHDRTEIKELSDKCLAYLKLKLNNSGIIETETSTGYGTEENSRATAALLQAILSSGDNPLGGDWIKGGKTIYDGLMLFKAGNQFKETSTSSYSNKDASIRVFAALSDLTENKSMYERAKIQVGETPASVKINAPKDFVKEKQTLKLSAFVYDTDGKLVPEQDILWTVSDNNLVSIDVNGLLSAKDVDEDKTIVVTAQIKGTEIKTEKNITVKARIPYRVEIKLPANKTDNNVKEGTKLILFGKIYEEDGEEISYEKLVWYSSDETTASVDSTGTVAANSVDSDTTVTITAKVAGREEVKADMLLTVKAIIPDYIKIYEADKEVEEVTLESGHKIKLMAKAFESDNEEIKDAPLTWESMDEDLLSVQQDGVIKAKDVSSEKTVDIKIKADGFTAEKTLKVKITPALTIKEKSQSVINDVKSGYEAKSQYDWLQIMAAKRAGIENINKKLKITEPNLKTGSSGSQSLDYSKAIIGLISAGEDPRSYKEKDYVSYLADSQVAAGHFYPTGYSYHESYEKRADSIAYAMIALDMAGADYNIPAAAKALKEFFKTDGEKAYVPISSYSSTPDLKMTALAAIALSNHENEEGIAQLLDKVLNYLKEQYKNWDNKTTCQTVSYTIQALVAAGEDLSADSWVTEDIYGNKITMIDVLLNYKLADKFKGSISSSYTDDEATALAFIAAIDANKGNSTYKAIKIQVGDAVKVEISSGGKDKIKTGKTLNLTAKAYDKDNNFVPKQNFIWSTSNDEIIEINESIGEIKGKKEGTAKITAKIEGAEVKGDISVNVIKAIPSKINIEVDGKTESIQVGRKIKINPYVYDQDDELIEKAEIIWTFEPVDGASIDKDNILTALKETNLKITAKVEKTSGEYIQGQTSLAAYTGKTTEEVLNETIAEVREYFKTQSSYDFMTSMALRHSGLEASQIVKNINIYGSGTIHNDARNLMNLLGAGENPRNYKGKEYVALIAPTFYTDSNAEYVAKAMIALDMAGADYEADKAAKALTEKLKSDGDKKYAVSYSTPDASATAWVLTALSNHNTDETVKEAIKGIKNYLKSVQNSNGLIDNSCTGTSLTVQALMALNEDPLGEEWIKYDKYSNKITMLDGILLCKAGGKFKNSPEASTTGYDTAQYALGAMADLYLNKSMFEEISYVVVGEPHRLSIKLGKSTVFVGEELTLVAELYDKDNNLIKDKEVIWSAGDTSLVKIQNGILTGLKEGEIKLKAQLKGNEDIFDEVTVKIDTTQDISLRVKASLENLIKFYEIHGSFDYMSSLASGHIKESFDTEKLEVKSKLRLYSKDYAIHYAKNIMEIIGAEGNPRNYPSEASDGSIKYVNYVGMLADGQQENGEFIVNQGYKDSIVSQSLSIIALDMAGAPYNEKAAVSRLIEMLKDSKYDTDGLYTKLETRALAITALSRHKDKIEVKTQIEAAINYIKSQQNSDGGFDHAGYKNNPFAIGTVIQALLANGTDPDTWVKNGKTMTEILLDRQIDDGGFEYGETEGSPDDEIFSEFKSTETAFAALADVYMKKSMYHSMGARDEIKKRLAEEIEFLKRVYAEKPQFEFIASPAAYLAGMDVELLQSKIFRYTDTNSAWQASKTIISLIGSQLNPRHDVVKEDDIRNYVAELVSSQVKEGENKGEFILTKSEVGDKNSIEALAMSIMALDMAGADYDKEAAVKRLIEMESKKDSHTYREVTTDAFVLTALSRHKDIEGVNEEIDRLITYFKDIQNDDGGFNVIDGWYVGNNSSIAIGRIIQALIANDINPMYSQEWIKNGNTMLDALLKSKIVREDRLDLSGYSKHDKDEFSYYGATYTAFGALVDLYNNESMFNMLTLDYNEEGSPAKIEIEKPENRILGLGKYLQLKAYVYDENNIMLEKAEIEWQSSDQEIISVKDGFIKAEAAGTAKITAKVKDTQIIDELSFTVTEGSIKEIKIEAGSRGLRPGDKTVLMAKVIDNNGKVVKDKEIKWESADESTAVVNEITGEVTALKEGTAEIRAALKEDESLKGSITLTIVPVKTQKVFVRIEGIENTVLDKIEVEVDNFDMNPYAGTSNNGPDVLKEPTMAHAVVKALKESGYDVTDKNVLNISNLYLSSIGLDKAEGSSGWMYMVNGKIPDVNMPQYKLKASDNIVICYVMNNNTAFGKLIVDKNNVQPGEDLKITLSDMNGKAISNAQIYVGGKAYEADGKAVMTDGNGSATIKFAHPGSYSMSAGKTDKSIYFIKPDTVIIKVEGTVPEKTDEEKISEAVSDLRSYYAKKSSFTFREALGYRYTGSDLSKDLPFIQSKYKPSVNPASASEYAGSIIGIISAGRNPHSYNEINYVKGLEDIQNNSGKFILGQSDDTSTVQAFSIISLDMAGGRYDVQKALKALIDYQEADGGFGGADETGMTIMALSLHKDVSGVTDSINKALVYLHSIQLESGGFNYGFGSENPYSISAVIQGIVAAGENPLSDNWRKKGKSMLDALLVYKNGDHFENVSEWSEEPEVQMATEQAFIALADMYRGKSMFDEIRFEKNVPAKIEITKPQSTDLKENEVIKLTSMIYDKDGNVLGYHNTVWESLDKEIAEISKEGILTATKPGSVTVKANIEGYEELSDTIEFTVEKSDFEIKRIGDEKIKKGTEGKLQVEIKNNGASEEEATFIIVLYNSDQSKMINYTYISKKLESGETVVMTAGFLVPSEGDYIVKGFVWDSFDGQEILLGSPLTVEVE